MRDDWPVAEEFFYPDPQTGEYVYKYADERLVLVDSRDVRSLFEQYEGAERARKLLIRENDQMGSTLDVLRDERDNALSAYHSTKEQLEAHRTFADHFLQWCETVAAEEDNPIHLLVREAEALNPASEPEGE